jgi:hypothetical protein
VVAGGFGREPEAAGFVLPRSAGAPAVVILDDALDPPAGRQRAPVVPGEPAPTAEPREVASQIETQPKNPRQPAEPRPPSGLKGAPVPCPGGWGPAGGRRCAPVVPSPGGRWSPGGGRRFAASISASVVSAARVCQFRGSAV